ncbi:MAG TPA: diphosphomevalonate decarboxylase [Polyangiaceae bacterium]
MPPKALAIAEANANIALIKYWGKLARAGNFPAVPSLSLTLDGLRTRTRVELDAALSIDEVNLDGEPTSGRPLERVVSILEAFRALTHCQKRARVTTSNDFPTAAGLASSASGFAALVTAANAAYGAEMELSSLSAMARAASASAARSLFGGWAELRVGSEAAAQVAPEDHWPLVLLVAVTARGKKSIGSTEAMNVTRSTSPYYAAWVEGAPALFEDARAALLQCDLTRLGCAMEQSTLMMHAVAMTANPRVLYLAPTTVAVMQLVTALRTSGKDCYFTMDAGPHVKVLCRAEQAKEIQSELARVTGVLDVLVARPGPGARVVDLA